MGVAKIRKNLLLDKELVENVAKILSLKHKSFSEAINTYFKAILKDPNIVDEVQKLSNKRTGAFIGMLDGMIGDIDIKEMKKEYSKAKGGE